MFTFGLKLSVLYNAVHYGEHKALMLYKLLKRKAISFSTGKYIDRICLALKGQLNVGGSFLLCSMSKINI